MDEIKSKMLLTQEMLHAINRAQATGKRVPNEWEVKFRLELKLCNAKAKRLLGRVLMNIELKTESFWEKISVEVESQERLLGGNGFCFSLLVDHDTKLFKEHGVNRLVLSYPNEAAGNRLKDNCHWDNLPKTMELYLIKDGKDYYDHPEYAVPTQLGSYEDLKEVLEDLTR